MKKSHSKLSKTNQCVFVRVVYWIRAWEGLPKWGWENCLKYFKRVWNPKEGRGNKIFTNLEGRQTGLTNGCLKKEGSWNPLTNYGLIYPAISPWAPLYFQEIYLEYINISGECCLLHLFLSELLPPKIWLVYLTRKSYQISRNHGFVLLIKTWDFKHYNFNPVQLKHCFYTLLQTAETTYSIGAR